MSSGTNPAYSHLANQRAIYEHLANHLLEKFVGSEDRPAELIECPYIPGGDGAVPREEVIYFIDQLRLAGSRYEDEMNRFEFVRRNDGQPALNPHIGAVLNPGRALQAQPQAASGADSSGQEKRKSRRGRSRKGR